MGNALLARFRPEHALRIVGAGRTPTALSVDMSRAFAVLARTNAALFEEAVAFLATDRKYHFVGGTQGCRMDKLLDTFHLWSGDTAAVRDPYLRSFAGFEELQQLAEDAGDAELRHLVRVVEDHGARVPALVEQIQARHVELRQQDGPPFDGIVFSTAQNAKKAKGLEFEQVWLADDFMRFFRQGRELTAGEVEPADVNLLYVALTRAKAAVRLGESFAEWLRYWSVVPPEGSSQR